MPEAPATWLDASTVTAALGEDLAEPVDTVALQSWCDGTRSYVEGKRSDLFVPVEGDDEAAPVFTPTPSVVSGAVLLAWRFYARRTTPLGVLGFSEDGAAGILREDPDVAKLLGIGKAGRFVFGGYNPCAAEVESA